MKALLQPKKAKRGKNPFLAHRSLIRKMVATPGTLDRYRLLYRQVKGTEAEEVFWSLLHWRSHADEMQALAKDLSKLLYRAARERDLLLAERVHFGKGSDVEGS